MYEERTLKIVAYKVAKREAKKAVAKAKGEAYEEMYTRLDTKEGANAIFKLAKARERGRRGLGAVKYIKDDLGQVLVNDVEIKKKWIRYFFELFNEARVSDSVVAQGVSISSARSLSSCENISKEEVKAALMKMGRAKAVGPVGANYENVFDRMQERK
ncbi:hypothetical protein OROHE_005617 [Orobanche hederae]